MGHDAVICSPSQSLFFFFLISIYLPIIHKLNLAVIPSITTNNPQLKLFSPNSRAFNSIKSKNYTYSYLYSFSPVLYNHSPVEEHFPTHILHPPPPRAAPLARGAASRTPPRLRPRRLFPQINTQIAFQKFTNLISRFSHRSKPIIPVRIIFPEFSHFLFQKIKIKKLRS